MEIRLGTLIWYFCQNGTMAQLDNWIVFESPIIYIKIIENKNYKLYYKKVYSMCTVQRER